MISTRFYPCRQHKSLTTKINDALIWAVCNPRPVTFVFGILVVALVGVSLLTSPQPAHAVFPLIPILVGLVGLGVGAIAIDQAATSVEQVLRDGINMCLSVSSSMLQSVVSSDLLTKSFDQIYPSVQPIIYTIHQTAVIPVANVVLAIFLIVGLGKVVQSMGRTESGVDLWQLIMVFVSYALAKAVIDASYELMILCFDLVRNLIKTVMEVGVASGAMTVHAVPKDVNNTGILVVMAVISVLSMLVTIAVCLLSQVVVIVRGIQIYVYTAFAALPLAFFTAESSRSMATGFLKRYIALLFSGAIMALLFIMFGLIIGNIGITSGSADTIEHAVKWICEMCFSLTSVVAFGWCIFKSGAWARDFVGV